MYYSAVFSKRKKFKISYDGLMTIKQLHLTFNPVVMIFELSEILNEFSVITKIAIGWPDVSYF